MNESFIITITYKGKPLQAEARFIQLGYTYKFEVIVNDAKVYYERDDTGAWRAIAEPDEKGNLPKQLNNELLQLVAQEIEKILA